MGSTTQNKIDYSILRLPHPWLSAYRINKLLLQAKQDEQQTFRLEPVDKEQTFSTPVLHHQSLAFSEPVSIEDGAPPADDNTPWARARRSPLTKFSWSEGGVPSVEQAWLTIYALFTIRPGQESFRLILDGPESAQIRTQLLLVGLAIETPLPSLGDGNKNIPASIAVDDELLVTRCSFWQGAGSPFGTRAPWAPDASGQGLQRSASSYPVRPLDYIFTSRFPEARVFARHPIRPSKPTPGEVVYTRYIPHLGEHLSLVALDWKNDEHVKLFNKWQNDPRVAAAWNETGTLEEHREYLRKSHEDRHLISLLGRFDDNFFAYFEVYWAMEDTVGAYFDAGEYDRGWHALVGEDRFRGPHRVRAWMSAVMHYMLLDDPRTDRLVGEPRASGKKIIAYEVDHGFHIDKTIDFPHKRAALVLCSRENFFRLCPFHWGDEPTTI